MYAHEYPNWKSRPHTGCYEHQCLERGSNTNFHLNIRIDPWWKIIKYLKDEGAVKAKYCIFRICDDYTALNIKDYFGFVCLEKSSPFSPMAAAGKEVVRVRWNIYRVTDETNSDVGNGIAHSVSIVGPRLWLNIPHWTIWNKLNSRDYEFITHNVAFNYHLH